MAEFAYTLIPYGPRYSCIERVTHILCFYRHRKNYLTTLAPTDGLVHALAQVGIEHKVDIVQGERVISVNIPLWDRYLVNSIPVFALDSRVRTIAEIEVAEALRVLR
jgi:hypothetical protein